MATEKLSGTPTENPYGASNTDSYAEAITKQYADAVKAQNDAVDQNVSFGQEAMDSVNQRGQNALNDMSGVAAKDYADMKTVASGIEQNNGNRQQIGQSQYGIAENSYDQHRASIDAARAQLEKDVARQVADLVEERFPKLNGKVEINNIGTTIGSHTGPGTVALFFWGDVRND